MKHEFVCTVCPNSCELKAGEHDGVLSVTGNKCKRGIEFAMLEVYDPQRILTTTVKLTTGGLLPVRSQGTVKKRELWTIIRQLKSIAVELPVEIGDVVANVTAGTPVCIVAADTAHSASEPISGSAPDVKKNLK